MPLHTTRPRTTSLLTGLGAIAITSLLWTWFEFTTRLAGNELFLAYNVGGAFVLGALPAALLTRKRLVSPAVVVGCLFLFTAYSTWSTYVAPATPPTPVDPTPFGWYLLGWPVVVLIAVFFGGVEHVLRRYQRRTSTPISE